LDDPDNATMTNRNAVLSTVLFNIKLCEEFAIEPKTSLTVYFIISLLLFYITISLAVYAYKNKLLFMCEGRYIRFHSESFNGALNPNFLNLTINRKNFWL